MEQQQVNQQMLPNCCIPFRYDENTELLPPRPVHQLAYFHGPIREAVASSRLLIGGDFLVFLNSDQQWKPALICRNVDGICHCHPIMQNNEYYFGIHPEDFEFKFLCIYQLIDHYLRHCKPILKSDGMSEWILQYPVHNERCKKKFTVERVKTIEELSYYWYYLDENEQIVNMLYDGDFMLHQNSIEITLAVRWKGEIKNVALDEDLMAKSFALPKINSSDPTELVFSLDSLLKSLMLSQGVVDGVQFKRPIRMPEAASAAKPVSQRNRDGNTTRSTESESSTFGSVFAERTSHAEHVLLNGAAPMPFYSLPFYHGQKTASEAAKLLKSVGDYLLYKDLKNNLHLAVLEKNEEKLVAWNIKVKYDKNIKCFYMKNEDKALSITTVQELINYYVCYNTSAQNELPKKSKPLFDLRNAVANTFREQNGLLEKCQTEHSLSYHFSNVEDEEMSKLLKNDGDFLLRNNGSGEPQVCVYWDGKILNITIERDIETNRFALPRMSIFEPREFVEDIDQYLKSILICGISLGGAVLKTPIRRNLKQ